MLGLTKFVALTYTDNSAAEMLDRVRARAQGHRHRRPAGRTFHAWCNGLLQRRGAGFGVLDDKDLWVFLRRRIRDLRLKHFVRAANVGQFLDSLLDFMRRCQDELVGPAEYARYVERLEREEIPLPRVTSSKKQSELEDARDSGALPGNRSRLRRRSKTCSGKRIWAPSAT